MIHHIATAATKEKKTALYRLIRRVSMFIFRKKSSERHRGGAIEFIEKNEAHSLCHFKICLSTVPISLKKKLRIKVRIQKLNFPASQYRPCDLWM
jgi:hypothetical protein